MHSPVLEPELLHPALVANTYREGSYSEIYPDISRDETGLKKLFTRFSFAGGDRSLTEQPVTVGMQLAVVHVP